MTNAEKYLKDGINKEELFSGIANAFFGECSECDIARLNNFFYEPVQPTLSEDERVILRNMKNSRYGYTHIARTQADEEGNSDLYIFNNNDNIACDNILCFDHLFQFIKNGEEYEIKELLK